MNKAINLLKELEPELLKVLSNCPDYGSIGLSITLHDNQPVRIESSRSITIKMGGSK